MRFSLSVLLSIVLLLSCLLGLTFYDSREICLTLPFALSETHEFSHNKRLFCYEDPEATLLVFDLVDKKEVARFPGLGSHHQLVQFSKSNEWLRLNYGFDVYLELKTGHCVLEFPTPNHFTDAYKPTDVEIVSDPRGKQTILYRTVEYSGVRVTFVVIIYSVLLYWLMKAVRLYLPKQKF